MTLRRKELEIEGDAIDSTWEEVVRACLAKNPERRPQSVAEIARSLEVPSPKTRRAAQVTEERSNKIAWVASLFALVLAAIGCGIGFYSSGPKTPARMTTVVMEKLEPKASSASGGGFGA